eukprot:3040031-Alexandrium_andersonii.AAC.1
MVPSSITFGGSAASVPVVATSQRRQVRGSDCVDVPSDSLRITLCSPPQWGWPQSGVRNESELT